MLQEVEAQKVHRNLDSGCHCGALCLAVVSLSCAAIATSMGFDGAVAYIPFTAVSLLVMTIITMPLPGGSWPLPYSTDRESNMHAGYDEG